MKILKEETIMKRAAQITSVGDELHVKCPYEKSVVGELRLIGGRWDGDAGIWILPASSEYLVHRIVRTHFQVDGPMPQYKGKRLVELYRD
jgi:hypothetical protein